MDIEFLFEDGQWLIVNEDGSNTPVGPKLARILATFNGVRERNGQPEFRRSFDDVWVGSNAVFQATAQLLESQEPSAELPTEPTEPADSVFADVEGEGAEPSFEGATPIDTIIDNLNIGRAKVVKEFRANPTPSTLELAILAVGPNTPAAATLNAFFEASKTPDALSPTEQRAIIRNELIQEIYRTKLSNPETQTGRDLASAIAKRLGDAVIRRFEQINAQPGRTEPFTFDDIDAVVVLVVNEAPQALVEDAWVSVQTPLTAEQRRLQEEAKERETRIRDAPSDDILRRIILTENLFPDRTAEQINQTITNVLPVFEVEFEEERGRALASGVEPPTFDTFAQARLRSQGFPTTQDVREITREPAPVITEAGLARREPSRAARTFGAVATEETVGFIPTTEETRTFQQAKQRAFRAGVLRATEGQDAILQNFLLREDIQKELQQELEKAQRLEGEEFARGVFTDPRAFEQAERLVENKFAGQERVEPVLSEGGLDQPEQTRTFREPAAVREETGLTEAQSAFASFKPKTTIEDIIMRNREDLLRRAGESPAGILEKRRGRTFARAGRTRTFVSV